MYTPLVYHHYVRQQLLTVVPAKAKAYIARVSSIPVVVVARRCAQPKTIWPHCDVAGWFSCAFSMVGWIFRPAENVMLLTVFTHHAIEVFFFQMKFAKKQVAKKIKVRTNENIIMFQSFRT